MGKKRERIVEKLKELKKDMSHKQRFVVMDSDTFKERWSFQLSARNLFVAIFVRAVLYIDTAPSTKRKPRTNLFEF